MMSRFKDRLWSDLVRAHGADLSQLPLPPARSRRRPRMVVGTGLGLAAAGTAAALLVGTAGTSPAFAVTKNNDGSITVSIRRFAGIPPGKCQAGLARVSGPGRPGYVRLPEPALGQAQGRAAPRGQGVRRQRSRARCSRARGSTPSDSGNPVLVIPTGGWARRSLSVRLAWFAARLRPASRPIPDRACPVQRQVLAGRPAVLFACPLRSGRCLPRARSGRPGDAGRATDTSSAANLRQTHSVCGHRRPRSQSR